MKFLNAKERKVALIIIAVMVILALIDYDFFISIVGYITVAIVLYFVLRGIKRRSR